MTPDPHSYLTQLFVLACAFAMWLAETGLLPSQSELIEQHNDDGTISVHVRKLEVQ